MKKKPLQRISGKRLRLLFQAQSVQYVFSANHASNRAIVVSNRSGRYQLYAVDFNNGFERQITHAKQGKLFGSISSDGQYIYILNDRDGGEYGYFMRTPFCGGPTEGITPDSEKYFSYSVSTGNTDEVLCFTAAIHNHNTAIVVQKNKQGIRCFKKRYISPRSLSESICAPDGKFICLSEADDKTKLSTLLLLSIKRGTDAANSRSFAGAIPLAFSDIKPQTVCALARIRDWYRPIFYDFIRHRATEMKHRAFRGDVWVLRWNENQDEMILCDVYRAGQKLYLYNTRTKRLRRIGPRGGNFNFHFNSVAMPSDGSLVLKWNDFNTPSRLIKMRAPYYDSWEEISPWSGKEKYKYIVEHKWTHSSDGERIHMLVVKPRAALTTTPFVIDIHGGPHGVTSDEFSPEAHAWLQNGFGYCAVNYRGSIGFGKKFERKIYGHPGKWEVEDVVAARAWLVRNKYADKNRVALYGWSWGGYITLLALGKYPKLWSCGIAGSAIADCIMQYEDEPAYFKTLDQERFRGTPATARSRYVESSPITYADRVQAPILLLHGKNDARCPARQIISFTETLQALKKKVFIKWFNAGHTGGFTNTDARIKLIESAIRFASNVQKATPFKKPS